VPLSLSQGTFDALISSDESVNSAKLWEAGVRFSYVDNQFLAQYIPMVGNATWEKLSKAHQMLMTDLWASNIAAYDKGSIDSQARARGVLEKNGVTFHDATASELSTTRTAMIGAADSLIKDAKLSPELVKLVKEAVG
jgi:C4-dicarboxylate-binding protein DctP